MGATLYHGSPEKQKVLRPTKRIVGGSRGYKSRGLGDNDANYDAQHVWMSKSPHVAETYALGGQRLQGKRKVDPYRAHGIDRPRKYGYVHTAAAHPSYKPDYRTYSRSEKAMASAHSVKPNGGYWVTNKGGRNVKRTRYKPIGAHVEDHPAATKAVGVAAAGAAMYGGYRLHKHFHDRKQQDRLSGTHNPYYQRRLKSGQTVRVKKGKRG